jgi:hypothetical protein
MQQVENFAAPLACPLASEGSRRVKGIEPSLSALKAATSERQENVLVTKLVTNSVARTRIGRHAPARAADFRNTNQHLSGQNETGRNGYQQISSAVPSSKPRTCKCLVGPG